MEINYPLVNTATIDGVEYELNLAFDNILRLFDLLEDKTISDLTKVITGLKMLVLADMSDLSFEEQDTILFAIMENVMEHDKDNVDDQVEYDLAGNPMPIQSSNSDEKVFDMKQDAPYIYASFMSDYGINLYQEHGKLHWQEFQALLHGLTDASKLMRVIDIRTMELPTGKGTSEQRSNIQKMQKQYALK